MREREHPVAVRSRIVFLHLIGTLLLWFEELLLVGRLLLEIFQLATF